jgi:hypothetical protein
MEGMKYYEGKRVFLKLLNGRVYSGEVIDVDESALPLVYITILDKFSKRVMFCKSEISTIQEEA